MKFKGLLTLCLAGASLGAFAQTHVEGAEYYNADQLTNAKDLLLRSLKNSQTDKSVSDYYLGMISIEEGKDGEAANYFSQGITANAENPYNYVGQGLLKLKAGDVKAAEELFKTADKNSKKDAALQIAIARAYDRVDPIKYEKQIAKQVEKARKFNMEAPEIYVFDGDQKREAKNFGGAGSMYEMATTYDKNYTPAYVKYANLFTDVNPDYAIKMLQNLLQVNPNSALGQRELANAYYNKKDFKNAAAQYGKYVQNPSHFKSDETRYAILLFFGGEYQKAYDYATSLLKQDPNDFVAQRYQFMNAAQIPAMKGQMLDMADALIAAHNANPGKNKLAPIDYRLISNEYKDAKRTDDAIALLQEALKENPDDASFYKDLSFLYLDKEDYPKSADIFGEYMAKSTPGYNDYVQASLLDYFAGISAKDTPSAASKYYTTATEFATKAKEMNPDSYRPIKILGDIARQTAPNEAASEKAAVTEYEQSLDMLQKLPDANKYASDARTMAAYLANYYAKQGDSAKSKEYVDIAEKFK